MDQTNVLFVPYRPGKAAIKLSGEISQQKHAAREYHRKVKQRRNGTKQSIADDTNFNVHTEVRVPLQRARSATALPTPSLTSPGGGKADPFNSFAVTDMSPYAQEMLDYGMSNLLMQHMSNTNSLDLPMAALVLLQSWCNDR